MRDRLSTEDRVVRLRRLTSDPSLQERVASEVAITLRTGDLSTNVSPLGLAATPVMDLLEVRRPPAYKADRKTSGLFAFTGVTGTYHVWFESLEEKRHWTDLTWRGDARSLSTQPLVLRWTYDDMVVEHIPDALVERPSGSRLLLDVHGPSADGLDDLDFVVKRSLTDLVARAMGWDYEVLGPLPAQRAVNLDHLWLFRDVPERIRSQAAEILTQERWPRSIGGLLRTAGDRRAEILAVVFHMLWHRCLWSDLDTPMRTHTRLETRPRPEWLRRPWVRWPKGPAS